MYIDGSLDATVDTYNANLLTQRELYVKAGLSNGSHTIKIVVRSDKNPSNGYYTDVDALEYTINDTFVAISKPASMPFTTKVNDNDSGITYSGTWGSGTESGNYNDDGHWSNTSSIYAQYTFTGAAIKWIGSENSDHGKADVYIDGVLDATVDTYNSSWSKQYVLYVKTGLSYGSHTIKIVVRNDKNPLSSGYYTEGVRHKNISFFLRSH